VLLIRRIRELLYEQGFTISGARNKLDSRAYDGAAAEYDVGASLNGAAQPPVEAALDRELIRAELLAILDLLQHD
jgi:hypothetical protein